MWTIALKTLLANRGKLFTALTGVVFSVVLVNIQGGLFLGLMRKAALLVDCGEADIWVGHKEMHNVDFTRPIPRRWIDRIRGLGSVDQAYAYVIGFHDMTLPSGGFEQVAVVGVEQPRFADNMWNIVDGRIGEIRKPDGIVVDVCDDQKLDHPRIGEVREIGGRRARVVAKSQGITGFLVTPYVFTTIDRAADFLRMPRDRCSYILVRVRDGVSVDDVCQEISQRLPEAEVMPRGTYGNVSIDYWMTRTGLGISFGAATLLGLGVGLIIVAQTLYTLVLDRIAEFAALKAMGATDRQVYRLIVYQAMFMAIAGSIIGLVLVLLLQSLVGTHQAPILIPAWLSAGSCLLVSMICLLSSVLPYLRIRRIDPQMVLQS